MDITKNEQKAAYRWFFGAGLLAICLSIFLATVDKKLTNSDHEQVLGETLRELRTAQTSLGSRVTDARQVESHDAQGH